jgi:hypothetical protein
MTDNQRFWGFSKTRLKSMLASELQDEGVRADLESTRNRTLKARLIRTTDATGQVVDFKNSVVGPVVDHSYVAPSADELLNRTRTVTGKALRGYEEDAEDGDGDGKIQDSTPYERPAPTGSVSNRKKKPKRKKRQERTSKPKRRRLIDSLRNIGKRREGESAQDRASRVSVNAIEGGRGPEEFPEEDGQSPDEVMAEFEQMFNDMWGEENEESPDDVIRDLEEMFDDLEQQGREEREQANRDSEERIIERENLRREEVRDIEPLPFEKNIPEDGLSPADLLNEGQRDAARYLIWQSQLSDADIEDLVPRSDEDLVEEILDLRERSQKMMDKAKNPDGDESDSMVTNRDGNLLPETVRTVNYGIGFYLGQLADYLEDRLVAREGTENVPTDDDMDQPNFDDPASQKLWNDLSSQIEKDKIKNERIEQEAFDLIEQEQGRLALGRVTLGAEAETEEELRAQKKLLEKFGGFEKYNFTEAPEDAYLDLNAPRPEDLDAEDLTAEDLASIADLFPDQDPDFPEDYSEQTTPPELPNREDMPEELEGRFEYLWEMYLEDQAALLPEIEPGRYFRLNTFPYWLSRYISNEAIKIKKNRLINHVHNGRFKLKEPNPDEKVSGQDILEAKAEFDDIFDEQGWPEGNPDFKAVLTIVNAYLTYVRDVSKVPVTDRNGVEKRVVPLTKEEFIDMVATRGLGGFQGMGEDFPLKPREKPEEE